MNDLTPIFDTLKAVMKAYEPPYAAKLDDEAHYDLWSNKEAVIDGRKRKEVYFAALIIQKAYVGFYYMPVYIETEQKKLFKPELLKLLKGKSCFHIKKLDDELLEQISEALQAGHAMYQERGWV